MPEHQTSQKQTGPQNEPSDVTPTEETPQDALKRAEKKVAENLAGWQRARADYENLARRLDTEVSEAREAGTEATLRALLPVIDNFEAATRTVPDTLRNNTWVEGTLQSAQAFRDFLSRVGVTPITETGMPLDPTRHEAIAEGPSDQIAGTVTEVIAPGYVRGGRILRPAKVRISTGPETTKESRTLASRGDGEYTREDPIQHARFLARNT